MGDELSLSNISFFIFPFDMTTLCQVLLKWSLFNRIIPSNLHFVFINYCLSGCRSCKRTESLVQVLVLTTPRGGEGRGDWGGEIRITILPTVQVSSSLPLLLRAVNTIHVKHFRKNEIQTHHSLTQALVP